MANTRPSQRFPAPSLFVGPPSQNASTLSLQQQRTNTQKPRQDEAGQAPSDTAPGKNLDSSGSSLASSTKRDDFHGERTEAVWAEMQNTLEEVELNAASSGNAFSADHAHALEDLRKAQIELAKAWARSDADDEALQRDEGESGDKRDVGGMSPTDRAIAGSSGMNFGTGRSQLEEETDNDILLARKRRQANDRYFEKVNKGVVDVVGKLEEVAKKMRAVEVEAQDIWNDRDSLDSRDDVEVTSPS